MLNQLAAPLRWGGIGILLSLALGSACQSQDNRPVLAVNGTTITKAQYQAELDRVRLSSGEPTLPREVMRSLKADLLNELIEQHLVLQQAEEYGLRVTDGEVQARLSEYQSDYPDGAFQGILRDHGVQADGFRERLRIHLVMQKLIDEVIGRGVEPDEEEIERHYRSRPKEFAQHETIRLHQIVVQTREEAEAVRSRIMKGEDFAELARRHSLTPEAVDGGDLGNVARDSVPKEFSKAFELEPDQLSTVVQSPYGYHIFLVSEHVPARVRPFEEVRDLVRSRMVAARKEAAYQAWLGSLREDANIRIYQDVVDDVN